VVHESKIVWALVPLRSVSISNGVRQGGVLSPIMFTVYLDDLLADLESSGVGCFWNQHFVGAVYYVDDVALLLPLVLPLSTISFTSVWSLLSLTH